MAGLINVAESALANPFVQSQVAAIGAGLENAVRNAVSRSRSRNRGRSRTARAPPMTEVGDDPGTSDSKRHETVLEAYNTTKDMCTLHSFNVTGIDKDATGADALNTRERDTAVIKGFKMCQEVVNLNTTLPMYFNLAVVVPRDSSTISNDDFFRAQAGDTRTADFDPTALSANELHCLPINTDKYRVLKHMRKRIEPAQIVARGQDKVNVDFYMPIKRQFRWDDSLGTPRKDIFICLWTSYFSRTQGTTAASGQNDTTEDFGHHLRVVTYFSDPSDYIPPRRAKRRRKY